jgi:hypothetical protein
MRKGCLPPVELALDGPLQIGRFAASGGGLHKDGMQLRMGLYF